MMSYKIIDMSTDNGRELFQSATAAIDNAIEVEKIRLAVIRLGRDDPFAALPKRRNGRPSLMGDDTGYWQKRSKREGETQNGERKEREPRPSELEVRHYASDEEGKPTYETTVELPPLKPLVRKLGEEKFQICGK